MNGGCWVGTHATWQQTPATSCNAIGRNPNAQRSEYLPRPHPLPSSACVNLAQYHLDSWAQLFVADGDTVVAAIRVLHFPRRRCSSVQCHRIRAHALEVAAGHWRPWRGHSGAGYGLAFRCLHHAELSIKICSPFASLTATQHCHLATISQRSLAQISADNYLYSDW